MLWNQLASRSVAGLSHARAQLESDVVAVLSNFHVRCTGKESTLGATYDILDSQIVDAGLTRKLEEANALKRINAESDKVRGLFNCVLVHTKSLSDQSSYEHEGGARKRLRGYNIDGSQSAGFEASINESCNRSMICLSTPRAWEVIDRYEGGRAHMTGQSALCRLLHGLEKTLVVGHYNSRQFLNA
jgi:hypothetical protein